MTLPLGMLDKCGVFLEAKGHLHIECCNTHTLFYLWFACKQDE